MSGFYEWKGPKGKKQPYAISMRNRRWFYVAGLWDRAYIDDEPLDSFTILTTAPNDFMEGIHNRMPLIPEQSDAKAWITGSLDERMAMIAPYAPIDTNNWDAAWNSNTTVIIIKYTSFP